MQSRSVMVVDGDPGSRSATASAIASSGLAIVEARSGKDALRLACEHEPSVVLAELTLPDVTGLALLRMLRGAGLSKLRMVLLSSLASEEDRVIAFEHGFDDFVARPYSGSELAARVRAILRRSPEAAEAEVAPQGSEPGDPSPPPALRWQRPPTPKELRLVGELVQRGGRVVSRRELLRSVWGEGSERTERVVDAHIKAIRGKLGPDRYCVETVRGVGYRYREQRSGEP